MNIHNPFNRVTYAKTFSPSSKKFECKIFSRENIDKYDIYLNRRGDSIRALYVLKDSELSKILFNIINYLKDMGSIKLTYCNIRIVKTVINFKEKKLLGFYMDIYWDNNCSLSNVEKMIEFVYFYNKVKEFGFEINMELVSNNYFPNIFEFMCFLVPLVEEESKDKRIDPVLDYVHYSIQKESFRSYYDCFQKEKIISFSKIKYSFELFKVFYNYYKNKEMSEELLDCLKAERKQKGLCVCGTSCNKLCNYLGFCTSYYSYYNISRSISLVELSGIYEEYDKIEETEEYIVFEIYQTQRIKIYKNTDNNLLDRVKILSSNDIACLANIEVIDILLDTNANFVGYRYCIIKNTTFLPLNKLNPNNTETLIYGLWDLEKFIVNLFDIKSNSDLIENKFNIENDISFIKNQSSYEFNFSDDESLLRFLTCSDKFIKTQFIEFVFKLYSSYVMTKHGLSGQITEEMLYSLLEIKILPPQFTKELCNYLLNKEADTYLAYISFFDDFRKNFLCREDKKYLYYNKFFYAPSDKDYFFDYQVIKNFGFEVNRGIEMILNDGRVVHFFKRRRKLCNLIKDLTKNSEKIEKILGYTDTDVIHRVGINNVIYSKEISDDGSYYMVGYVTDPIKGKILSEYDFSKFTNKDFIRIAMNLFVKFDGYHISLDFIRMDDEFNFYISLFENISIDKNNRLNFALDILDNIRINGLDHKSVASIDFSSKTELEKLYNSMTSFCDIHQAYFSSFNNMCPVCQRTIYDVGEYDGNFGEAIFEDKYAVHYKLTDLLNIKVYKENAVDLKRQEENIDSFLECELNVGQNLFLPYKKAVIISSRKFIGYVYESVDFSTLMDLNNGFSNLNKLKGLRILCAQVLGMEKRNLFFYNNPYSSVFCDPSNKKIIQLVNIDFLDFCFKGEDTKENTYSSEKFIISYVSSSLSNEIGMEEISADSLYELFKKMKELLENMTKSCAIHGIYYHKKHILCPVCFPNFKLSDIEENIIYLNEAEFREEKNLQNEGGEAYIFEYSDNIFAKIFKEENINIEKKVSIFMKIFERKPIFSKLNRSNSRFVYVTPQKIIVDNETKRIIGYTMEKIEGCEVYTLRNRSERENLGLSTEDILEILINFGDGIEYLHKNANMYIGDLNGCNVLFDKNKIVYFLDLDGMGIDDIKPEFFTEGYVDPIAQMNRTISMEDDWYSFAIQAFYYLTLTHPFNGIYYDELLKRNLSICEKMERRISLLGNHGMKPPAVAISWEVMSIKIQKAFLRIFEGEIRENITPYLKEYYNSITTSSKNIADNTIKANITQIVVREISLFGDDCVRIVNAISYISVDENGKEALNICISKTQKFSYDCMCNNIVDVILSDNKEFAYIICKDSSVIVICINTREELYHSDVFNMTGYVVNGSTLYYSGLVNANNVIMKLEFGNNKLLSKTTIKVHEQSPTKSFFVVNNEKFVIVKKDVEYDYVFCNDQKYYAISQELGCFKYRVLYDVIRKEWLVINNTGFYMVIKPDGTNIVSKDAEIAECNIERVVFSNSNIYIPKDGGIYVIRTRKSKTKYFDCSIVTKNSQIIIIKEGFYILSYNKAYEYVKL